MSQQAGAFESLLASARQAQARGDFVDAAKFYEQAADLRPDIPELQANLGLMYYQIDKDEQAIRAFRYALRLNRVLFVPNLFLGLEDVKLKRFNEAIPYLKRAALSNPADVQAQLGLGQAYSGIGKTRLATAAYLRAAQLSPQEADSWYHLGISYLEQVEADARILLTRHKDSGFLQTALAETFSEQRAFIQAETAYKKALELRTFPPGTHAGYGFVLLNRGDYMGAERELKAELKWSPSSQMAKLGLARLCLEQGSAGDAASKIEEIWKTEPGFLQSNAMLFKAGLARPKRLELQQALEETKGTKALPEDLLTLFRISTREQDSTSDVAVKDSGVTSSDKVVAGNAAKLCASGRYTAGTNVLAVRLQSLQARDIRLLAWCAYSSGNYRYSLDAGARLAQAPATEAEGLYWETRSSEKLATQALSRASQLDSGSPKLHVLLGDIYRQRQSFPDAEQEYRKALALQPNDTGALFGLALALLADNLPDEASRVAQDALANSPDDPEINAVMGEILCARHDLAGAEPYLKKSLNAKPEYVLHVHALLGNVYAHTDRIQEAMTELKLALPGDKDGSVHYQIGRLYLKVGDKKAAKDAFEDSQRLKKEGLEHAVVAMQQGEDDAPQ